ncbi:hypothetical protein HanPI659440_Chr07g0276291 [Helianthus annuus]|nr:hypothetical protein HanPI659440_Chr07g0276291 [Helianthus annuus]
MKQSLLVFILLRYSVNSHFNHLSLWMYKVHTVTLSPSLSL